MIETRWQNAVAGGVDPGNPEACRISATAVNASGYNLGAGSRNPRSQQLAFEND
jgi:hypothetical protein